VAPMLNSRRLGRRRAPRFGKRQDDSQSFHAVCITRPLASRSQGSGPRSPGAHASSMWWIQSSPFRRLVVRPELNGVASSSDDIPRPNVGFLYLINSFRQTVVWQSSRCLGDVDHDQTNFA
jgi:hypothetical protein